MSVREYVRVHCDNYYLSCDVWPNTHTGREKNVQMREGPESEVRLTLARDGHGQSR